MQPDFLSPVISYLPGLLATVLGLMFVCILPHELGHWAVARWFGFRTPVFSIGFGKRNWSLILGQFWQTEFRLSPILFGGYVEIPEIDDTKLSQNEAASKFPVWQKIAVALAGVVVNVLMALFIMVSMYWFVGEKQSTYSNIRVDSFSRSTTLARDAGFQPGDRLLAIGDTKIALPQDVSAAFAQHKNVPVLVRLMRKDSQLEVLVTPNPSGMIGIGINYDIGVSVRHLTLGESVKTALITAYETETHMFADLGKVLGFVPKTEKEQFMGIVGVIDTGARIYNQSGYGFWWLMAVLNLNLALMNLLPVPVLDGGHVMFYMIEAVRGKPLSARIRATLTELFLHLMILLAIYLTWQDLTRMFADSFLAGWLK